MNGRDPTELIGQRFDRLVAVGITWRGKKRPERHLVCLCDCGKQIKAKPADLRRAHTRSCGCWSRDRSSAGNRTHGDHKSTEYRIWTGVLTRCFNPNVKSYPNYGGRGITVCDRWRGPSGYENFLADMGRRPSPGHSIDRIDNARNYEPSNCRWATWSEQMRNRRPFKKRSLTDATVSN